MEIEDELLFTLDEVTTTLPATNQSESGNGQSRSYLLTAKITVQSIILALAIFGNSCLLAALYRRKGKLSRMHIFILHLSLADMLVAFFSILPQLIWEITQKWLAGDIMCRFVKFMQIFVMYLSTYILVLTALDRRRAICNPLSSHTWTFRLVHLSVGVVYLISAALSTPQAIIFKYQAVAAGSEVKNCWVHFNPEWTLQLYITAFTVLVYILPLFILIYSYGSIYYTIVKRQKYSRGVDTSKYIAKSQSDMETMLDKPQTPVQRNGITIRALVFRPRSRGNDVIRSSSFAGLTRAKLKTVKLTLVIIIAYIACWSPFFISQLWWLYDESASDYDAVVIMLLLASLNSCCNPWIYLAFSGTISCSAMFSCRKSCCGLKSQSRPSPIEHTHRTMTRRTSLSTPSTTGTSKLAVHHFAVNNNILYTP